MILLELFAGSRSISKAFKKKGFKTYSVDWDKNLKSIDLYADIEKLTKEDIIKICGGLPDVIWASPDCTTYSVAAISKHRRKNKETGNLDPITEYALKCDKTNKHILELIKDINPKIYFIENPMGALRNMNFMKDLTRYTITYCQYGEKRMKPTDIWTNHPNPNFKPPCKRGDKCHEPAPRGSKTGTQGIKGSYLRSKLPEQLCDYVAEISYKLLEEKEK